MFTKTVTKLKVVEVEPATKPDLPSPEMREMLRTLQHNPAFRYIVQRLKFQKAVYEQQLKEGTDLPEKELRVLQAFISATGWVDKELARLTAEPPKPSRDANEEILDAFARAQAAITGIQ